MARRHPARNGTRSKALEGSTPSPSADGGLCKKTRNPKSEIRKKEESGNDKTQNDTGLGFFDFGFLVSFGFRASDFEFSPKTGGSRWVANRPAKAVQKVRLLHLPLSVPVAERPRRQSSKLERWVQLPPGTLSARSTSGEVAGLSNRPEGIETPTGYSRVMNSSRFSSTRATLVQVSSDVPPRWRRSKFWRA